MNVEGLLGAELEGWVACPNALPVLLFPGPPNAKVDPGPVADDGAGPPKPKDARVEGRTESLLSAGLDCPNTNPGVLDGTFKVCPNPPKGLFSSGLLSLANGLELDEAVLNEKDEDDAGAEPFD